MLIPVAVVSDGEAAPSVLLPPVTGYSLLLDASDTSMMTFSSGRVTTWSDKSGNGNDATAVTENGVLVRPYNNLNSRNAMLFTGFNYFSFASLAASDTSSTTFVVAMLFSQTSYRSLLSSSTAGANQWVIDGSGQLTTFRSQQATIAVQGNATIPTFTPFIAIQVVEPTQVTQYINATSETDVVAPGFSAGTFSLGASNGTLAFYGLIGEVIFYNTSLSSGDVTSVRTYLASKWDIS